jgi:hypothetical protein
VKFFHGVIGPDFFVEPDGSAEFCADSPADHFIQIYAPLMAWQHQLEKNPDGQAYQCDDPEYASVAFQYNYAKSFDREIDFGSYY